MARSGPDGSGAHYRFLLEAQDGSHPVDLRVIRSVPSQLVAIELGGALPAEEEFTISPEEPGMQGDGAAPGCQVGIALTLLVPNSTPAFADAPLLERGTDQIEDELERMAALLEAASSASSV